MDNKKCLKINGAIERKDGKEIDINNFVDKFVNFIEQEGYFYGGSFEYDKKLEEKELREYTKSEMLDLENRIENLIKDCNKRLNKELFIGYRINKKDDIILLLYSSNFNDNQNLDNYMNNIEKITDNYLNESEIYKLVIDNVNKY